VSVIPETADERRKRLLDERQRASTFHQHGATAADDEVGGRFGPRGRPQVIGEPTYPASALSGQPDAGQEPPTGYCINDMVLLGPSSHSTQAPPSPASDDAPLAPHSDVERRGAGLGLSSSGGASLNLAGGVVTPSAVTDGGAPPPSSNDDGDDDAA